MTDPKTCHYGELLRVLGFAPAGSQSAAPRCSASGLPGTLLPSGRSLSAAGSVACSEGAAVLGGLLAHGGAAPGPPPGRCSVRWYGSVLKASRWWIFTCTWWDAWQPAASARGVEATYHDGKGAELGRLGLCVR